MPKKFDICYFCGNECDHDECYCHGCGDSVCENCEVGLAPLGQHQVDAHRDHIEEEGLFDECDEEDED